MDKQKLKINSLVKYYKGKDLIDKNIYKILDMNLKGIDVVDKIKNKEIGYYGDIDIDTKEFLKLDNLVLYTNIFQKNSLFVREETFMNSKTQKEKKEDINQIYNVQLLTEEEIKQVNSEKYKIKKLVK